ncbi:hypothetical protein [Streptomyces sp. Iso 434]|uniref:hypothetical protein n=2 Tax=Streptomyces TaxID=1883 RepID=UPI0039810EDF
MIPTEQPQSLAIRRQVTRTSTESGLIRIVSGPPPARCPGMDDEQVADEVRGWLDDPDTVRTEALTLSEARAVVALLGVLSGSDPDWAGAADEIRMRLARRLPAE